VLVRRDGSGAGRQAQHEGLVRGRRERQDAVPDEASDELAALCVGRRALGVSAAATATVTAAAGSCSGRSPVASSRQMSFMVGKRQQSSSCTGRGRAGPGAGRGTGACDLPPATAGIAVLPLGVVAADDRRSRQPEGATADGVRSRARGHACAPRSRSSRALRLLPAAVLPLPRRQIDRCLRLACLSRRRLPAAGPLIWLVPLNRLALSAGAAPEGGHARAVQEIAGASVVSTVRIACAAAG
jgi:hypothetical protein